MSNGKWIHLTHSPDPHSKKISFYPNSLFSLPEKNINFLTKETISYNYQEEQLLSKKVLTLAQKRVKVKISDIFWIRLCYIYSRKHQSVFIWEAFLFFYILSHFFLYSTRFCFLFSGRVLYRFQPYCIFCFFQKE